MALWMLTLAERPADDYHPYGHSKAEYFSSAFEGFLILFAALAIGYAAVDRLLNPAPLDAIKIGLLVSVVASVINFTTASILLRVGKKHNSITLEADGHHLMTDVWTSAGVIIAVGLVSITGWLWLDPVIALIVAANIIWTGWRLVQRSADGLLDASLPAEKLEKIETILAVYSKAGLDFHALRTRQAGDRTFLTLHVLVPGDWTVKHRHDWAERIEKDIRSAFPRTHITTHLEPIEDPISMIDQELDRTI